MNIDDSIFSRLTDEQKKKLEEAKTPEELISLAKDQGYELTPDQLEAIAGGEKWDCHHCPKECGSYCHNYQGCGDQCNAWCTYEC